LTRYREDDGEIDFAVEIAGDAVIIDQDIQASLLA
jgi:hypothetical protein